MNEKWEKTVKITKVVVGVTVLALSVALAVIAGGIYDRKRCPKA